MALFKKINCRFKSFSLLLLSPLLINQALADTVDSTITLETLLSYQNTAWIVWVGVMVLFMQAGFALLESGSVRSKNVVNVMMKNYIDMCVSADWHFLRWAMA